MSIKPKYLLAAFAFLCLTQAAFAQKDLEGDNVTVVKAFDAQLLEANKINVPPTLPALDTNTPKVKLTPFRRTLPTSSTTRQNSGHRG